MDEELNYLSLFLPTVKIEPPRDNTLIATRQYVDKQKAPTIYKPIPVITQGRTTPKTESERYLAENTKKQVELKEQQQKEAKKKVEALEKVNGFLDFLSPAKHYEAYTGKDLNGTEEFAVDVVADPTNLITLGGAGLLKSVSKKALKEATEEAIEKASREGVEKSTNNAALELAGKIGKLNALGFSSARINPFTNQNFDFRVIFNNPRQKLIDFYSSSEYLDRLLKAGFTEKEAKERINALLENLNIPVKINTKQPWLGMTNTTYSNNNLNHITINPKLMKTKDDLYTTGLEELLHASELNGRDLSLIEQEIKQLHGGIDIFKDKASEEYEDILKESTEHLHNKLHNDKANLWNSLFFPGVNKYEVYKNMPLEDKILVYDQLSKMSPAEIEIALDKMADYYRINTEGRARGIGALLDFKERYGSYNKPSSTLSEPRNTLGKEYFKYYTGKNKFNYLDNLVSFGGGITTTGLLLNYLQNENKK